MSKWKKLKIRKNLKKDQNAKSSSNKQLTNDQEQAIFQALLANYEEGKLKRGTIKKVAEIFNLNYIGQGTIRSTAEAPKIPKSTLFDHIQCSSIWFEGGSGFSANK